MPQDQVWELLVFQPLQLDAQYFFLSHIFSDISWVTCKLPPSAAADCTRNAYSTQDIPVQEFGIKKQTLSYSDGSILELEDHLEMRFLFKMKMQEDPELISFHDNMETAAWNNFLQNKTKQQQTGWGILMHPAERGGSQQSGWERLGHKFTTNSTFVQ